MEDTGGTVAYRETPCPLPLKAMTLRKLPNHDGNTFALRLDSRRLCQMAQSEVWRLDKSKFMLIPFPLYHMRLQPSAPQAR